MNHPIQPLVVDSQDREQFAQLTGYSLSGFGELSYVRMETYAAAALMAETGVTETEARIAYLEEELASLRNALREPVARLFGIHPDDIPQQP